MRELEGALKGARLRPLPRPEVTLEVAKEALRTSSTPTTASSPSSSSKTVADYYKIKVADMHSKKRTGSSPGRARWPCSSPRISPHASLPAIGEAFGGRDHTTVLHACRTIAELRLGDTQLNHDLHVLTQVLRG